MIWKPIPSYPNYEASDQGDIRRIGASVLRSFQMDRRGYLRISLWQYGKRSKRLVSRLVCEAFHGPSPSPKLEAAHENGTPPDNRSENLSWKTRAENMADMKRHGTDLKGEKCNTHLTGADVILIRDRIASAPRSHSGKYVRKGHVAAVAREFRLSRSAVWYIVKRKNWSHV